MHLKLKFLKRSVVLIFCTLMCHNIIKAQSISNIPDNYLVLPAKAHSISFYWQGDTINTKLEEHTAILLPVRLKNCSKLFYMQFDLGSPYSLFYKNKLVAIQAKYPKVLQLKESDDKLTNYSFKIDKMPLLAKQIVVKQFDNSAISWTDKNSIEVIGTIGADLIDGKVAIIDYPNKKLTITQAIPAKLKSNLLLTDFIYAQRRILLPARIKGKQTILYFDTGSSMYELLTDKKTAQSLAVADSGVIQSKVKSWDKYLTANTVFTNDSLEISSSKLAIRKATFIDGISNSQVEQMMKMGIGGMTGNKLFLAYKLVLDTKNKKFGLVHSR
jgi:hypothetical protein